MRKRFFLLALILALIPAHSFAQVEKEASGYYGIVGGDIDDKGPSLKVNPDRSIDVSIVGGGGGDGKILDGTAVGQADVIGSAPAGTEQGLVTRNIPSGTQTISGTVTANAGTGTFLVGDGTGPLTVDGTVTANAGTGTFTVDSEMPAASALADNEANPTVPRVGAMLMCYDAQGLNWDRCVSSVSAASDFQVSCTTTSTTLRAANAARLEVDYMTFTPTTEVSICYAATCTTTAAGRKFSSALGVFGYRETSYSGAISCITASGTVTVGGTEK